MNSFGRWSSVGSQFCVRMLNWIYKYMRNLSIHPNVLRMGRITHIAVWRSLTDSINKVRVRRGRDMKMHVVAGAVHSAHRLHDFCVTEAVLAARTKWSMYIYLFTGYVEASAKASTCSGASTIWRAAERKYTLFIALLRLAKRTTSRFAH